jgi:hypothetical protein
MPPASGVPAGPAYETVAPDARPEPETASSRSRRGLWIGLGAAAIVVIAVVVGVSLPGILGGTAAQPTPVTTSDPKDPVSAVVPEPEELAGTVTADGVEFTWANPDPQDGDRYLVGVVARPDEEPEFEPVDDTRATVPADPSGTTCVEVLLVRENGQSSDAVRGCAP